MKNLSVLKPDMAVLGQDRVGLTPFGLLTQLFTREVTDRAGTGTGAYQPIALAFVEQGEEQEQPPAPQINLELELTVVLERLGRQLREEGRPPSGVQQRIVEQVLLRGKQVVKDAVYVGQNGDGALLHCEPFGLLYQQ